jgi:hypothetical protein
VTVIVGWKELGELWKGPRVITWADRLVHYCDHHTFFARDAATVAESLDDLELQEEDDVEGNNTTTRTASQQASPRQFI